MAGSDMRLISRTASILRALALQPGGLSLAEIAKLTNLPRATVQRIVGALGAEGLVTSSAATRGVRLGVELARIAASVHADIRGLCHSAMEALNAEVGDTVDLTMLHRGTAVVIDQVLSARALRVVSHIGTELPLHCTASGKAHLASLEESLMQKMLQGPLKLYTANTTTDGRELHRSLINANLTDCWFDDEEFAEGVCAIATPLQGIIGGNYAIAVSLPKQHFAQQQASICLALRRCREAIEQAAGIS